MKIALLMPRSVIYPSMSFDIMDGFKSALKKIGIDDKHEIVTAGIGVGGNNKEIYECCEQLLLNGTDIIIAYVNPLTAEFVQPIFESAGKLLIVLDSGYQFQTTDKKLSNVYFISLEGTLCTRAIVNKAIEEGQNKFAFTASEIGHTESIIQKLIDFQIAIPSWALGTGGTRFGRFAIIMDNSVGVLDAATQAAIEVFLDNQPVKIIYRH